MIWRNSSSDYYDRRPNIDDPNQLVIFGTSGHRGSSLRGTFTEAHILAITQAICEYRKAQGIDGPLFMGKDTHAPLGSGATHRTGSSRSKRSGHVDPTRRRLHSDASGFATPSLSTTAAAVSTLADGIVITPSHNPPEDGGFKYNPPNGGPADTDVTSWIENRANELLKDEQ